MMDLKGIEYLSHLCFLEPAILKKVIRLCERALKKGRITTKQKWSGVFYEKEILTGYVPPVTIDWIDSCLGYGVFATADIPSSSYVGEYTGEVRKRKRKVDRFNAYCFDYSIGEFFSSPFLIDAQHVGNHTRFINHSDKPNLEPMSVYCGGVMHVILRTLRPISKGEQLTYDYGQDYWKKREKPQKIRE